MIKIGIDCSRLEGTRTGAERYLANLLKEFRKNSGDFKFYLFFKNRISNDDFLKDQAFEIVVSKNLKFLKSSFFWYSYSLSKTAERFNLDIIFSPNYIVPKLKNVKRVVAIHDISYETHPEWYDLKRVLAYRFFYRSSINNVDQIITISDFSKKEIVKNYKIDPQKIKVTSLAADEIFKQVENNDIKEKFNIQSNFLLYVGSIFNRRHVSEILKAFKNVSTRYPKLKLVLIGKNQTYPYVSIKELIFSLNIKNKVIWKDFISNEDLAKLYNAAEIFLYPSTYEGFGLPVLEAMQCGCPVITSNASSFPEVVGDAGIKLDKVTAQSLENAISKILSDENLRDALVQKGLEQAGKFSWKKCATETLEVFKSLA